eukprot:8151328-Pyramimonas_sp.AAC.1
MPAVELPPEPLPGELLGAERARKTDARGGIFIAWFPRRLKGYLSGSVPGRKGPVQEGARCVWHSAKLRGARRAEQ